MAVYREPGEADVYTLAEKKAPRCGSRDVIGTGFVLRGCATPGFWSRLFNGIGHDDRWHCECGTIWKWYVNHWSLECRSTQSESVAK